MQYIFFVLFYFYLANWRLIHNWFHKDNSGTNILAGKTTNKKITDVIFKATHVKLEHVYIAPSKALFAFCGGVGKKPILVISKGAYETFTGDALEWLLLHEIGHHVLDHSFGIITVQLSYAIVGGFLLWLPIAIGLNPVSMIILIPLLAILLAIASIQTNKLFDIYANTYAVRKMEHPLGMKEGALLFIRQAQQNGIQKDTILMKLFYPWNYAMWHRTIRDAEKEVERRKQG